MTVSELLSINVPATVVASILEVTPRQIRKARQGQGPALQRLLDSHPDGIELSEAQSATLKHKTADWERHLHESSLRDEVYRCRRALRKAFEREKMLFEDSDDLSVHKEGVRLVEQAHKLYVEAKQQAAAAGLYVNDNYKLQEHLKLHKALQRRAKKANKKIAENPTEEQMLEGLVA